MLAMLGPLIFCLIQGLVKSHDIDPKGYVMYCPCMGSLFCYMVIEGIHKSSFHSHFQDDLEIKLTTF